GRRPVPGAVGAVPRIERRLRPARAAGRADRHLDRRRRGRRAGVRIRRRGGAGRRDHPGRAAMTAEHTADVGDVSVPPTLRRDLEAVMMVVDQPVSEYDLARAMDVPLDVVTRTLEELSREYTAQGRGFDLRAVAEGWR